MLDLTVYPKEIISCLNVRYDSPPDDWRVLLSQIYFYKINANPMQREP